MQPQMPAQTWDDEIDLRQLIESVWRRRWVIGALIVAAVAVAGVLSYFVLPPRYEASITVDLLVPEAEQFGFDPPAYRALATSNRVLESMNRLGVLNRTPAEVRELLTLTLSDSRLLTVTASGQSAAEAHRLALLWYDAFRAEIGAYAQERIVQRLNVAEAELVAFESRYYAARDMLNAFDSAVALSVMEARLESLQSALVAAEERLRALTQDAIPADEARLTAIELALAEQPPVLGENSHLIALPGVDAGAGITSSDVAMVNPVYLQLSQDLASTRTRLATNRRVADLLEGVVAELPAQIEALQATIVAYREDRERLEQEVTTLRPAVEQARAERDRLLVLQQRLKELAFPAVVSDPILPSTPVAPKGLLNMAVAGFLAAFIGVVGAVVMDFWAARKDR